jgi:hypothetical protein
MLKAARLAIPSHNMKLSLCVAAKNNFQGEWIKVDDVGVYGSYLAKYNRRSEMEQQLPVHLRYKYNQ